MEEAPENGKESPHSAHANGLIDGRGMAWAQHAMCESALNDAQRKYI
jgi:hypothetical protein